LVHFIKFSFYLLLIYFVKEIIMKIQLLTAATILALASTSVYAGGGRHHNSSGISNDSTHAMAVGKSTSGGASSSSGFFGSSAGSSYMTVDAGRAIAGSIVLEGGACACDLDGLRNKSRGAIAVGNATAGSIHINTAVASRSGGGDDDRPRR
jgi:hypothetical protein